LSINKFHVVQYTTHVCLTCWEKEDAHEWLGKDMYMICEKCRVASNCCKNGYHVLDERGADD
jgi:hypothetical protein